MNVAHWGYLRSLLSGEITRLAALQQMRHTTDAEKALYQLQSQLCADLMVSANLGTLPEAGPLTDRLAEAEALIAELEAHEGAEGWSTDLRERLDRYSQQYGPSPQSPTAARAEQNAAPAVGKLVDRFEKAAVARYAALQRSGARITVGLLEDQEYQKVRGELIAALGCPSPGMGCVDPTLPEEYKA